MDNVQKWIEETFGDKVQVFRAAARILDLHAPEVSKGRAARNLQKRLGKKYLVCVGDGENDVPMLDLCYEEDSGAMVDLNCVMDEQGGIIELQGTGEGRSFTVAEQQALVCLCAEGIGQLIAKQKEILEGLN